MSSDVLIDLTKRKPDKGPSLELAVAKEFSAIMRKEQLPSAIEDNRLKYLDEAVLPIQKTFEPFAAENMPNRKLPCTFCLSIFHNLSDLNIHIEQYHKKSLYTCNLCQRSFTTTSGLYSHKRVNHGTGQDLLECKICGKKLLSKARLTIHERSHSDSRMYQCLQCNKSYKHKYSLASHNCTGNIDQQ